MYIIFISQPPVLKAYNSFVPPPSHKLRGKKNEQKRMQLYCSAYAALPSTAEATRVLKNDKARGRWFIFWNLHH